MDLKILKIDSSCTGCGACANICPKHCLQLQADEEGFFYPRYDATNCIECGLCEKTCHVVTPQSHPSPSPERFFLYRTYDTSLLQASTSGGGFTLFAKWVLDHGGVDRVMLDNFSVENTRKAVEIINGRVETESSGGITIDTLRAYGECGVDYISVGALTHSIKSLDMSFKAC